MIAALLAAGCGPRYQKERFFTDGLSEFYLREQVSGGEPVDQGFSHPTTISPTRLAQILARIEIRENEGDRDRVPAIDTELIYTVAEGVSKGLAAASPSQEVLAMAVKRQRNLKLFTEDRMTSLVVWVRDDRLFVQLGQVDALIPKDPKANRPKPPIRDKSHDRFQVVAADGISVAGPQLAVAAWRDPIFAGAGAIRVRPGGQVIRRTILMETPAAPELEEGSAAQSGLPGELSPEALRALADVEEQRRRGELTEAEYQSKRRRILSGEIP